MAQHHRTRLRVPQVQCPDCGWVMNTQFDHRFMELVGVMVEQYSMDPDQRIGTHKCQNPACLVSQPSGKARIYDVPISAIALSGD